MIYFFLRPVSFTKSLMITIGSSISSSWLFFRIGVIRWIRVGLNRLIFFMILLFRNLFCLLLLFLNHIFILFFFLWHYPCELYEVALLILWIITSISSFLAFSSRFTLRNLRVLLSRGLLYKEERGVAWYWSRGSVLGFLIFGQERGVSEIGSRLWNNPTASQFLFENGIACTLLWHFVFLNVQFSEILIT